MEPLVHGKFRTSNISISKLADVPSFPAVLEDTLLAQDELSYRSQLVYLSKEVSTLFESE
jgi:hypothetical protein